MPARMHMNSADPAFKADPYPFYAELRTERPITPVTLNGMTGWLVADYDTVRALLLDPRLSNDPRNAGPQTGATSTFTAPDENSPLARQLLKLDDPDHARVRKLVNRAFTARRVEALRPRVQEIADDLITRFPASGRVDFMASFALPLPLTVITEILGVDERDRDEFVHWANIAISMDPAHIELAPLAWQHILELAYRLVAAKSGNDPETDLLSALVAIRDGLTEDELVSVAPLVMLAGYRTTADMLANGLLAMLTDPVDDPGAAVDEVLRHSTPVEMPMPRFATADFTVGDIAIKRGDALFLLLASANRDETRFPRADRFDAGRDASGHLAFGHGAHFCVGAHLARMEGEIAFRTLFHRLPDLRLDVEPGEIRWQRNPHLRGPVELPVAYTLPNPDSTSASNRSFAMPGAAANVASAPSSGA